MPSTRYVRSVVPRLPAGLLLVLTCIVMAGCREDSESPTGPSSQPELAAAASSPLTFRTVVAGGWHSCGVTTDNRAFCWGLNTSGQLGDGTVKNRFRPVLVQRGLQFVQVSAGYYTSCGITTDNLAYCWGSGEHGQLGNGESGQRARPVPVKGGLHFTQVTMAPTHSCALTTDKLAYCWGMNFAGQLGDGTTSERSVPVPVAGGLHFRRLKAAATTCSTRSSPRRVASGRTTRRTAGWPASYTHGHSRRLHLRAGDRRLRHYR